jgi:hypothetical protein
MRVRDKLLFAPACQQAILPNHSRDNMYLYHIRYHIRNWFQRRPSVVESIRPQKKTVSVHCMH